MLSFRLAFRADVFVTPTMVFTLLTYAHDMALVLVAQPSLTEASTSSPRYDPRALDFFQMSVEEDNDLYRLDSTLDEGGHEGSIFGDRESSTDNLMFD